MAELEELFNEVFDFTVKCARKTMDFGEFKKELNKKYCVTLRNTDSSADNTLDEQLHSDEELVSKIEKMAFDLAESFSELELNKEWNEFKEFKLELKKILSISEG